MVASFVQVDVGTGPKMQSFQNLIGADTVEAEAVVLVDTAGLAYTPAQEATLASVLAQLDVPLSSRATEATLATRASEATVASILGQLDVALSTRASEATLSVIAAGLAATLDVPLSSRASEATVTAILAQLDVALSTRASEATVANILGQLDVALSTRASEVTAAAILAQLDVALSTRASEATSAAILAQIDVALSTRASEATLANVLTTAAFQARINTLGQKTMANSTPVVIASDQSAIPISGTITATIASVGLTGAAVPASANYVGFQDATGNLQGARVYDVDTGAGAELAIGANLRISANGGSIEAKGQQLMASSLPVAFASDQSALAVTNAGLTNLDVALSTRASEATLAGVLTTAAFQARINTLGQKTMANSTPVVIASDQSAVPVSGTVTATIASVGATGAAVPASADYGGYLDASGNLRGGRVYDTDTGAGAEYTIGAVLRKSASGGSVELGTGTDPMRVDPTGTTTQPISVASLPLPTGAATEATLATLLTTAAFQARINTLGQKTMANSTPVVIASDQSAIPVSGTFSSASVGLTGAAVPTSADQIGGPDASGNLRAPRIYDTDSGAGAEYTIGAVLRKSASGGSVELGTSTDPMRVDPTGTTTQPISAASLPLPTGAATEATLATLLTTAAFQARINTLGQKTMANSTPVVIASDQTAIPVTGTFSSSSVGATGAAVPSDADQIGGPDASGNLRAPRIYDTDSGGGAEYTLGVSLRKTAGGGSVELGTSSDPVRVDPTGTTTQPVSSTQLPAALVGARLDTNVGAWLGSTAPTVGQKTMANSVPTVIASDQTAIPVSGTVTATIASVGATGAAVPASADFAGFLDAGGLLRGAEVVDLDTGAGTEFMLGVNLRRSASGGSEELLGQTTMAKSVPVVIASDQSSVGTTVPSSTASGLIAALNDTLTITIPQNQPYRAVEISFAGGPISATFSCYYDGDTTRQAPVITKTLSIVTPVSLGFWGSTSTYHQFGSPTTADKYLLPIPPGVSSITIKATSYVSGSITPTLTATAVGGSLIDFCTAPIENVGAVGVLSNYLQPRFLVVGGGYQGGGQPTVLYTDSNGRLNVQISGSNASNVAILVRAFDVDSGAGSENVLGTNLRISASGGSIEAKGQQTMANSIPVVIASDQSASTATTKVEGEVADGASVASTNPVLTSVRFNDLIGRDMRGDQVGSQRGTSEVLLWQDGLEGSTVNAFWTQSTTTMTIAQATGVLTLNNSAISTANTFAIITSQRQFPLLPKNALWCRFRASMTNLTSNHLIHEFGLGAPTGLTAIISNGAFFRFATNGAAQLVTSYNGTENTSGLGTTLTGGNYYNFDIILFNDYARFLITDSAGTPVLDQVLRVPVTTANTAAVSHLPSFARVYTDATGGGTGIQLKIGAHSVQLLDEQLAATWDDQMSMAMRHASINPVTYAQNTQLAAGAAPAAFTPSNTAAGNTGLGGEAQVNSTATSENLLSIFSYQVPTPYTFMLRGLTIPRPIITTALGATACILEVFVIINCASGNISTGGGQRISLGLFRAAASAAAATALDGSDIVFGRQTPITCLPGTFIHIGWKMILGAATGVIRFVTAVDGYFN